MRNLATHQLTQVAGGGAGDKVMNAIDGTANFVSFGKWNELSCQSRAGWVGAASGATAGSIAAATLTPAAGVFTGAVAGQLGNTLYFESCSARQAASTHAASPHAVRK